MIIQDLKTPTVIEDIQKRQTGLPHWLPSKLWIYWRLEVWCLLTSHKRMSVIAKIGLAAANGEVYERLLKEVEDRLKSEKEDLITNFETRLHQQDLFVGEQLDQIIEAFKDDLEMIMSDVKEPV